MSLNKGTEAILVCPTSPLGSKFYSYTLTFSFVLAEKHAHGSRE